MPKMSTAEMRGLFAYERGNDRSDNPYDWDTISFWNWERGWNAGQADAKVHPVDALRLAAESLVLPKLRSPDWDAAFAQMRHHCDALVKQAEAI